MPLLIADEQRARLLANGQVRIEERTDLAPVVRLFTPDAHATWLLVSLDPEDCDTAYGLCDVGIGMPELGTVRLSALASVVGPRGRPIVCDRHFAARRPLSEYLRLAVENGSITD